MNLNQLQYFVVLARYEHYTKAAEELEISQPSLSHAMTTLERELGTRLISEKRKKCCPDEIRTHVPGICRRGTEDTGSWNTKDKRDDRTDERSD